MTTRKSQFTKSSEIHKSVSKNGMCELAQSCSSTSQRGIKRGWAGDRELRDLVVNQTQTNNTAPRPIKEEINQLARSWCELLIGQMQEQQSTEIDRCQ